eukprot:118378-Pyramimonas_sp.AAC.1
MTTRHKSRSYASPRPKAQSIRSPHPQTRTQSKSTKPRRVLGASGTPAPSTFHAVPTRGPPTHPRSQ